MWNGTEYVVAWCEKSDEQKLPRIRGMRFDAAGTALDDAAFDISPPDALQVRPSLAVTATGVEVAYSRIDASSHGTPRAFVRSIDRLLPFGARRRAARH
ncbi:MAG TPA: hypothetical protein VKB93_04025 [Thermoanaerobaculia bacterium]|nr:hypothetical protein [Thermoanaerobaculia bacterium]